MSESEPFVSTRQAAELLQVHVSSVKRWCNVEALACTYTAGGHRRIPLRALLQFAREQALSCHLLDFAPYEEQVWEGIEKARSSGNHEALIALVYTWLQEDLSRLPGLLILFLQEMNFSIAQTFDEVVGPVMKQVGLAWHRGDVTTGEEHRMTQMVVDCLHMVRAIRVVQVPHAQNGQTQPKTGVAVVGCISGEEHELGAMMVRLVLEDQGWHVVYLGANVPAEDFAFQQIKHEATLVGVSVMPPRGSADARILMRMLVRFQDPALPYRLALGGKTLDDSLAAEPDAGAVEEFQVFFNLQKFMAWLNSPTGTKRKKEVT